MTDAIREILKAHGRLRTDVDRLSPDADLFAAGMSSHATISVMLALEERFEIEFPDHMLKRGSFESIASIQEAVTEIQGRVSA